MKEKIKLIFLVLFSTCFGLLSAEIIAKYFPTSYPNILEYNKYMESERGKFCRYDRLLGWEGLKNKEDEFNWIDCRHFVRQNKYGYRGREYEFQRSDKKRLLVLGDSFVWGFGVNNEEIFTNVMEKKLRYSWEIINTGVSGYGNDQMYLLWSTEGYLWKPDRVILMITCSTDFWDNLFDVRYGYPKPVFKIDENGTLILSNTPVPRNQKSWEHQTKEKNINQTGSGGCLLRRSALLNLALNIALKNNSIRILLEKYSIIPKRLPGYSWEYPLYFTELVPQTEAAWKIMFKIIDSLNTNVSDFHGKLSVVIIPSIIQVYPDLWEKFVRSKKLPRGIKLDPEAPNKRIVDWCKKENIHVIDLLPRLKNAGYKDPYLYYPINRHWRKSGHLIVADILIKALELK